MLYDEQTSTYQLAPVFDNGNAFCNKATDEKITEYLCEPEKMIHDRMNGSRTAYARNGHILSAKKLLQLDNPVLRQELCYMVPWISENMDRILQFMDQIPSIEDAFTIMSKERKQYYQKSMEVRLSELLYPAYERALQMQESQGQDSMDER